MKDVLAIIAMVTFILLLFFIFYGEPDIWSLARLAVMNMLDYHGP